MYIIRSSTLINYNIVLLDIVYFFNSFGSYVIYFVLCVLLCFEGAYYINMHYIFTIVQRQIFYYFIIYRFLIIKILLTL